MADIRYLRKMINGAPVLAAPAEIDISTVLLDTTIRGNATVVGDMTRTRSGDCCGPHTLLRAHQQAWSAAE